jgi:hypothetical protein
VNGRISNVPNLSNRREYHSILIPDYLVLLNTAPFCSLISPLEISFSSLLLTDEDASAVDFKVSCSLVEETMSA